MLTRRALLGGLAAMAASSVAFAGYAFGVEPRWRLRVQGYRVQPANWPRGLSVRLAVLADIHASEPYMPVSRIEEIVATANGLGADAILLLGDYGSTHRWQTRHVPPSEWAAALSGCRAPLGVHAVLGNHDWWDDPTALAAKKGPVVGRRELEKQHIPVYENEAVRLVKEGHAFWLAGLGDQIAFWRLEGGRRRFRGVDDLAGTLGKVPAGAPIVLMAHEPDIFPKVPARVSLTLSGHTHGGQVRLFGYSPIVPSRYGNRYAYGHIIEGGRHLIVSGGLGCAKLPVRFGVPPEIVLIDIDAPAAATS